MKILLTGSNGFIGGRILARLAVRYGQNNIILLTSKKVSGFQCVVYKDYRNFCLGDSIVSDVDVLIHAGAFIPKSAGAPDILASCNDNVYFTERLLTFPLDNLKKIINISTSDVYAAADVVSECSVVRPVSFYASSKLYCEEMTKAFALQRGIACQILRIGHVYGEGEELYNKVIPLTINRVLNNLPVEVWGDGADLRSFIYVEDVVSSVLNSIERVAVPEVVNVVSGFPVSIKELTSAIVKVSGKNVAITFKESSHLRRNLVFDNAILRSSLLEVETGLLEGLAKEYKYMELLHETNI